MQSLQQMFDHVLQALRAQGHASVALYAGGSSAKYVCVYRGPNGDKCAAGHLIPDELYDPRMDPDATTGEYVSSGLGGSISNVSFAWRALAQHFYGGAYDDHVDIMVQRSGFLRALQIAHDDHMPRSGDNIKLTKSMGVWEDEMSLIAHRYNLTYTPPNA